MEMEIEMEVYIANGDGDGQHNQFWEAKQLFPMVDHAI